MPDQNQKRYKKLVQFLNNGLIFIDGSLCSASAILFFVFVTNRCANLTSLIYFILYAAQTLQHYLIYKFPKIDINKHHVVYRRIVISICLIISGYMFLVVTFWQKSQYHPIYCILCSQLKIGFWVGMVLVLHNVILIGWGITLIHSYVSRRYYLLALGGFQVQQRLIQQRARQLNEMLIIEPDTNPYPIAQSQIKDKYYKFQDVIEVDEQNYDCTICLNNQVQDDHFVDAGCGHYYHQVCLLQWAQVNQNCPQCRKKFQQKIDQLQNEEQESQEPSNKVKQIELTQYKKFNQQKNHDTDYSNQGEQLSNHVNQQQNKIDEHKQKSLHTKRQQAIESNNNRVQIQ